MNYNKLAQLLFPDITKTLDDLETMFPKRDLAEGAHVTRFAPSPTGFIHLGNLYGALVDERLAHLSGGVFYLRIEDTDNERAVQGATEAAIKSINHYGLFCDEGVGLDGEKGNYGPYRQRRREEIYKTVAKYLVSQGKAYPCFCTKEALEIAHEKQEEEKLLTGYYGKWASCRNLSYEDIEAKINNGESYIIRLMSQGKEGNKIYHKDPIKGAMELPENYNDIVLLKTDGIPTYHFAHVCDDHFMRTTDVVRGEEWLSTLPWHLQMFDMIGWKRPNYIHTAHMLKNDGDGKRKLSKRKDPELGLQFYDEGGYPTQGVIEYLMTLLNSNYEDWRLQNPQLPMEEFKFTVKKMSTSGALFDLDKLRDIIKNTVSVMTATEVFAEICEWSKKYDLAFYTLLIGNPQYAKDILSIGRGGQKPRKDLCLWSEVKGYMDFFYDELFVPEFLFPENLDNEDIRAVLEKYPQIYDENDDQNDWFNKLKNIAEEIGYAPEMKIYRKNPSDYKGHVGDVAMILRVAVSGKTSSPDTYSVMQILGKRRVLDRIQKAKDKIKPCSNFA